MGEKGKSCPNPQQGRFGAIPLADLADGAGRSLWGLLDIPCLETLPVHQMDLTLAWSGISFITAVQGFHSSRYPPSLEPSLRTRRGASKDVQGVVLCSRA